MTEFIHLLATPACVVRFNGEFVDANKWLILDGKFKTINKLASYTTFELMHEHGSHNKMLDTLQSGYVIQNQIMHLINMDNQALPRFVSASLISNEKQLILMQHLGDLHFKEQLAEKYRSLLNNLKKLQPFLNKTGKQLLDEMYNTHNTIINNDQLYSHLKYISHKLTLQYENLTNTELYLCALIALDFSTNQILNITGFSANTLRVNIHRICIKLNFPTREELMIVLKNNYSRYILESRN
jgi:DNA-binding CsgD family transcriptional regulator